MAELEKFCEEHYFPFYGIKHFRHKKTPSDRIRNRPYVFALHTGGYILSEDGQWILSLN
jgi:hypothetical protein